ncbi:MAG: glycosyltransferase family 2 protein [bacterium]
MGTDKSAAVIMRSKNEMPYAITALKRLFVQTWKDFTLYNVDSGSTDGTVAQIKLYNSTRLEEISPKSYVPGKVLNEMISKTTEPIVVFLNADAIPGDDHWLERLLKPIVEGRADAVMSKQTPRDDARFIVKYDYRRAYDPRNIKEENEDFFSAVACAFRRELWDKLKFPESGYAEDLAWARECRLQGARFKLVLDSDVEHSHNYTIKELYRKKFRHGQTYLRIYGLKPGCFYQAYKCIRELVRDFVYAVSRGRLDTIPYNLVYRITIHLALYKGSRA